MGGVKVGRSKASLPLQVEVECLRPPEDFLVSLEQHLLLVYTGKTRLARNLLQVCFHHRSVLSLLIRHERFRSVTRKQDCS